MNACSYNIMVLQYKHTTYNTKCIIGTYSNENPCTIQYRDFCNALFDLSLRIHWTIDQLLLMNINAYN